MKTSHPLISWDTVRGNTSAETLVLLLHGMDCGPRTVSQVADRIAAEIPSSYILIPALPFLWHRCADLKLLSEEILDYLDSLDKEHSAPLKKYKSIRIIGHSAGGVLAQSIYLISRESGRDKWRALGEIENEKIRLILIAPLSRGWTVSHHLPLPQKVAMTIGLGFVPLIMAMEWIRSLESQRRAQRPWMLQLQKGAPFLIWLRLAWLGLANKPEIFVLLGSVDEIISWHDMVDEVMGRDAAYMQVPYSDHAGIIDFEDVKHGQARSDRFAMTLMKSPKEARQAGENVEPWDVDPILPEPAVKRVVFVIHGIRDEGHWTQKIAAATRDCYAQAGLGPREEVAVVTSRYGYFSMLQFLMWTQRRPKIHWLMEQYVEARRQFPNAEFSYIGHSNGTYLLAQALILYPDVKFERIAFAGSVVSSGYSWAGVKRQVSHVLNFTATSDWVVAIFPRIADVFPLSWLFGPNLGGAGIQSFKAQTDPIVWSNNYVNGSHGAAIEEDNWMQLARFAVEQPPYQPPYNPGGTPAYSTEPVWCFRRGAGRIMSVLGWFLVLSLFAVFLPILAWQNPLLFWLSAGGLFVAVCVLLAVNQTRTQGAPFKIRQQIKSAGGLIVGAAALLLLVGLALAALAVYKDAWKAQIDGKWKMLSAVAYFWLLYKALTKV